MRRVVCLAVVAGCVAFGWSRSAAGRGTSGGFVEIDAVVVDRNGRPAHGLRAEDFVLKEDKHVAPVLTVQEIGDSAPGGLEPITLAVVLDDVSVVPNATDAMRRLARAFLTAATINDRIAIVRLSEQRGELLFGHLGDALLGIRNYNARGGDVDLDVEDTVKEWLDLVAHVAPQFPAPDGRRHAIIAIGSPALLDPNELSVRSHGASRSRWINAVSRLAAANAALYVIDSNGAHGYRPDADDGLAAVSGGKRYSTLDAKAVFSEIWRDMTNYYVLSYVPLTPRPMHDIDVKVTRRGLRVQTRRQRGE